MFLDFTSLLISTEKCVQSFMADNVGVRSLKRVKQIGKVE